VKQHILTPTRPAGLNGIKGSVTRENSCYLEMTNFCTKHLNLEVQRVSK